MKKKHDDCDVLIIGAGIVGLATALKLIEARPHLRIIIVEKESDVALHQTSHNSGVIHSGVYYRPGSSKSKTCIDGYNQLLQFCQKENISHEICGKVIVATTPEEVERLSQLKKNGIKNGLEGLELWGSEQLREREPHCAGSAALYVPQTGIIDFRQVALTYANKLRNLGVQIIFNAKVRKVLKKSLYRSEVETHFFDDSILTSSIVASCAGLQCDRLAIKSGLTLDKKIIPFRGEYYALRKDKVKLVKHLIYPVPDPAFPFLGVHFTRMINGGVECGPNAVLSLSREGYNKMSINLYDLFDSLSFPGFQKLILRYWQEGLSEQWRSIWKPAFVTALQRLVPELTSADLVDGGCGIRAQACHLNGSLVDDFSIYTDGSIVHVLNAPSPAATASLGIGTQLSKPLLQHIDSL